VNVPATFYKRRNIRTGGLALENIFCSPSRTRTPDRGREAARKQFSARLEDGLLVVDARSRLPYEIRPVQKLFERRENPGSVVPLGEPSVTPTLDQLLLKRMPLAKRCETIEPADREPTATDMVRSQRRPNQT